VLTHRDSPILIYRFYLKQRISGPPEMLPEPCCHVPVRLAATQSRCNVDARLTLSL